VTVKFAGVGVPPVDVNLHVATRRGPVKPPRVMKPALRVVVP
jgi:hypothetical protein